MAAADLALPHVQAGKHLPTQLLGVSYGPDALSSLPVFLSDLDIATDSPVLILTGRSLSSSPLLDLVKAQLGQRLAGVFSSIGQHSPLEGIRKALEEVERTGATVIVGFGGGSVIDAAKAVSYLHQEKHGRYLPQLALPTTLSAAELTVNAGYTNEMGEKVAVRGAELAPKFIIYDPYLTTATPEALWLSTGIRALDHAVENLYRPSSTPITRSLAFSALRALFTYLPLSRQFPSDLNVRAALQIAAWESLGNVRVETAMGLSHALGHQLGAKFGIPHGITSCLTLAPTIRLLATAPGVLDSTDRHYLHNAVLSLPHAFLPPYTTAPITHAEIDPTTPVLPPLSRPTLPTSHEDAPEILSRAVAKLVEDLGLETSLGAYGVGEDVLAEVAAGALRELKGWSEERKPSVDLVVRMLVDECLWDKLPQFP